MPVKTVLEQLEEVQTAITAVLNEQSYSIDGMTYTRANLRDLTEREDMLLSRYRRDTNRNYPRVSQADMGGS